MIGNNIVLRIRGTMFLIVDPESLARNICVLKTCPLGHTPSRDSFVEIHLQDWLPTKTCVHAEEPIGDNTCDHPERNHAWSGVPASQANRGVVRRGLAIWIGLRTCARLLGVCTVRAPEHT